VEFSLDLKTKNPKWNRNMLYIACYQLTEYLEFLELPSTDTTATFYRFHIKSRLLYFLTDNFTGNLEDCNREEAVYLIYLTVGILDAL
jgi:hypothetical protein